MAWRTPLIWFCWTVMIVCMPFMLIGVWAEILKDDLEAGRKRAAEVE